jgi:hypothetical protein
MTVESTGSAELPGPGGSSDDQETEVGEVSALFPEEEPKDWEAKKPWYV